MSRKTELINTLHEYMNIYNNAQESVKEIKANPTYSDTGREEFIQLIMGRLTETTQAFHDKAIRIVDAGLKVLLDKWKKDSTEKLMDGGYQAGLANVIKMLEMGAIHEKDDVENIIDTYSKDFNAMAAIRKILTDCNNREFLSCIDKIPVDHREKNKELLEQLKGNIDKYINVSMNDAVLQSWKFNYGITGVAISLDGMIQFVTDRLDDNLELLR